LVTIGQTSKAPETKAARISNQFSTMNCTLGWDAVKGREL
jgi:hypothetical protein